MSPTATYTQTKPAPEVISIALKAVESIESTGATEVVKQAFESPKVAKTVADEIKSLAATVNDIRRRNRQIRADVLDFDNARFTRRNGTVIALSPEWDMLSNRFDEHLNLSHRNAVEASAFMKQYTRAVLEDFDLEEIQDIKKDLKFFAEKLNEKVDGAHKTQVKFESLAKDVALFKEKIAIALDDAEKPINDMLKPAEEKLKGIEAQVKHVSDQLSAIGKATTELLSIGAGAVTQVIHTLAPGAMILVITTIFELAENGVEYLKLRRELSSLKPSLEKAREEFRQREEEHKREHLRYEKYERSLRGTQREIDGLVEKLEVLAHIWQHLQIDMLELTTQLELVVGSDESKVKRFVRKLSGTRDLYRSLTEMLDNYARGVQDSNK
ncbi:uncharacterized protein BXZ73DRAFT_79513 [Epithele typhae]|uniref:uncharacterized protein n=1 Tax=Epithele typhae TaxID=378194 RepID=UPI002007656A|nr:uncharacterized protein BXZ73DRAFT_79513 [Epithele typhae]KAH9923451.1 hypothetical protein BXZ73DRAFT_79513 [Epithele typhae]